MHYLSATNLNKSFGLFPLFSGLSFHIQEGRRIALVARNGMGKTTMLRIIAGKEVADGGKLEINSEVEVVFFEQEIKFPPEKTVDEIIWSTDYPIINLLNTYKQVLAGTSDIDMQEILDQMEEFNAWDVETKINKIVTELNLTPIKDRLAGNLSGGQQKRLGLAQNLIKLLCSPKKLLVLMDEPTNHLDIHMIQWLEQYLNKLQITLLMVSHDRYFLDEVANEIWELDNSKLYTYEGNYAFFLEQKAMRIESEKSSVDKARNEYRKELSWMQKQPKARTTKSKSRIDNFYKVEEKAKQKKDDQELELHMKGSRMGGKIVEMKQVNKSYGDHIILKNFTYTFNKGDRIGLIGKNGVGKTTFLNILQDKEPADGGTIKVGETITFGYYSQKGLEIKEDLRVIQYVKNIAEFFPLQHGATISAAKFLEMFLFPPDKQYTYLSALSGGEKKRLQLLTVLFSNPNFLILDEPTNDLDLQTLMVLENFLQMYDGCILLVSHDRYFMDKVVNHVFAFEGEGAIKIFPGNYAQYIEALENEKGKVTEEASQKPKEDETQKETPSAVAKTTKKISYKDKHEIEQIEKEITSLEEEKENMISFLANPSLEYAKVEEYGKRLKELTDSIKSKEVRWMEIMAQYPS